jgi:protein-disulfide isomerase
MAAGKSLTPFYVALGVIAVAGGALIARTAMKKPAPLTVDTVAPLALGPRGVVIGSDSAPVELMEFSDFECPWCARYAVLQMPDIRQRLVPSGRLRVRFVHYPLNIHQKSPWAHLAAACANEQGRFWAMADLIFENQDEWVENANPTSLLEGYAQRAGLDMGRYRSCVSERRPWGQVLADKHLGDSLGVTGTPTFYVNGHLLPDAPSADRVAQIVDSIAPLRGATGVKAR